MKKKIYSLLMIITIILTSSIGYASEVNDFGSKYDIEIDKEWNIDFNDVLDRASIEGNIKVVDSNGNNVPITYTLLNNDKSIKIIPLNKYKYSTVYNLLINQNIKSKKTNQNLKQYTTMTFETKKNPEAALYKEVLGSWTTEYNGINAELEFLEDNKIIAKAYEIIATGNYKIEGDIMTVNLLNRQAVGRVNFEGEDKFVILNNNGSKMIFTRLR